MSTSSGTAPKSPAYLFLLSADTDALLSEQVASLLGKLARVEDASLAELMLEQGRVRGGACRLAVVATSAADLKEKLEVSLAAGGETQLLRPGVFPGTGEKPGKLAFLFPGQGSQFAGMLSELRPLLPEVQRWFDELDAAYEKIGRPRPSEVLLGEASPELFDLQTGAQLGLVASLAMTELLGSLGIAPDVMLGHSNGEHGALRAAGAMGSKDAAAACAELARVCKLAERIAAPAEPEGMIAVACLRRKLFEEYLSKRDDLFLAIDNSPTQVILGGSLEAVERATGELKAPVALCSRLPFSRAYHTPLFGDWAELLREYLKGHQLTATEMPVYSACTTEIFTADADAIRESVAKQWSSTVRFRETIERMYADGVRVFVEVGPDAKLTTLVHDILRKQPHVAVSASSSTRGEWLQLLHLCGALYAAGVGLDMSPLDRCYAVPVVEAPTVGRAIRMEHQLTMRRIAEAEQRLMQRLGIVAAGKPRLDAEDAFSGEMVRRSAVEGVFRLRLSRATKHPYLRDHAMGSSVWGGQALEVLPFTFTLALVADAAKRFTDHAPRVIERVRAHRWLALDCGKLGLEIQVSKSAAKVYALQDGESQLAFEAEFGDALQRPLKVVAAQAGGLAAGVWTPERFYRDYAFHGPVYRCLRSVKISGAEVEAELEVTRDVGAGRELDPAVLDCAGQLVAIWLLENGSTDFGVFPFGMESFDVGGCAPTIGTRVRCRGQVSVSSFGVTSANFEFFLPDGSLCWRLTKLQQKVVDFPEGVANFFFGKQKDPFVSKTAPATGVAVSWLDKRSIQFLESGQGLWARVLAHGLLGQTELEELYAEPLSRRAGRVLLEVVMRESRRRWVAEFGEALPAVSTLAFGDLVVAVAHAPEQLVRLREDLDSTQGGLEIEGRRFVLDQATQPGASPRALTGES
jgi:malonyl CoA-acyl carrier protein transacylase